ncbi:MAG: DNA-3-methyladenine glycosylase I [Acidothermus sp.]|nr:DNA-3-methyladenine glycosylase I [Acidothermus sp.]MCL6538484.1 DNA-3-methyladenine glycosylase I [Acidothermus sp.]
MSCGLATGPDGLVRCAWAYSEPEYVAYHDEEWGRPVDGDDAVFERLALEAFQSGLSWIAILRRREAFREAFAGFRIDRIARFTERDIERLLTNRAIIRNRAKIEAVVHNARTARALRREGCSLSDLVWQHAAPADAPLPRCRSDIPTRSEESAALAETLRRHGFRFIGPTTAYAHMQATGMINDHVVGCIVADDVTRWRREFLRLRAG